MTTAETTSKPLHFSVDGDFVTGLARDFVEEGVWRRAYSLLADTLIDIDADSILAILQGKMKLTGTDNLAFVEDDQVETVAGWLDYQYGGCFAYKGKVYKPYGYVSRYVRSDLRLAVAILKKEDEDMLRNHNWAPALRELSEKTTKAATKEDKEIYTYRPAYYARDRSMDLCVYVTLPSLPVQAVLCEEVTLDVPLWYTVTKDAVKAIQTDYENRSLDDLCWDLDDGSALNEAAELQQEAPPPEPPKYTAEDIARDEARQQAENEEDRKFIEVLRAQIVHQTDNDETYGWQTYEAYDEKAARNVSIRVPLRALMCAALGRAHAWHLKPEYECRSPSGFKLQNDDRAHTDAWLGAGFSPDSAYDNALPEQRLFMNSMYELQRELLSFQMDVLARGSKSYMSGIVIHDPAEAGPDKILVVPTAASEYAPAAIKCLAVIAEAGSKLAHMTIVSREEGVPVLRMAGAVSKFKAGDRLTIDLAEGTVELANI